jgi:ABC-type uncharacterized transport system, ATPase component
MHLSSDSTMLSFERLTKRFHQGTPNETTVFEDFNLQIKQGEFVSIVGSNGSGKTTLLNLLCGSLPLDNGRILVNGADIARQPDFRRAAYLGRVFQDPTAGTCPSLTIMENMALAEEKGGRFGLQLAVSKKKTGRYQTMLEQLKMGLEDKLYTPVGVLSGGQRQALALLIATTTDISVLVLDEHTAALDPKSSETVMALTDQIVRQKKLTAIMVTHNLRFAVQYGSRLLMMDKGKCVLDSVNGRKEDYQIEDLLKIFNEISIECGN